VAPEELSEADFLVQYKALVISTLQPKMSFEQLASGVIKTRDAFSKEIQAAETLEAVEALLDKQYQVMLQTKQSRERIVKKSRYTAFRLSTYLLALVALGLGIAFGYTQLTRVPLQARIISSQSDFMNSNYDQVTSDLLNDSPSTLPKSAQYVLAASYIHLDNLTNEQKQAILNNLSQNSATSEFVYWIQIGRGDLKAALNSAQNIGDNQLILHAYTKLYDATNADTTMSGAQKQSLLNQYKGDIDKYVKLIGGKTNG
jgi:type VII secretion protein EssB